MRRPPLSFVVSLGAAVALAPLLATAKEQTFGPYDIPTLFFINKSDDHNRVDYAFRLDASCAPLQKGAVFPYWREFENSPPVRTHALGLFEHLAYGISDQHLVERTADGVRYHLELRRLHRALTITTQKQPDGSCRATVNTRIGAEPEAVLLSAFVHLRRAMSVDYVDIHGLTATGEPLLEHTSN